MAGITYCSPDCRVFRCGKNSLRFRGNTGWCGWTEEPCEVVTCNYAMCSKRRLLPKGVCGETVKRKTKEIEPEKSLMPAVKLKGKAFRKLGEKEIF